MRKFSCDLQGLYTRKWTDKLFFLLLFQLEEEQSLCDVSSLGSDDNTSLERNSSHGSDISISRTSSMKKPSDRHSMDSSCSSTVTACVEERECQHTGVSEMEGEEMDNITEVSPHVTRSKSTTRSASPPRRHSWEPWKHAPSDSEISRRRWGHHFCMEHLLDACANFGAIFFHIFLYNLAFLWKGNNYYHVIFLILHNTATNKTLKNIFNIKNYIGKTSIPSIMTPSIR